MEEQETKKTKELTPKQIFWIRFVFWAVFACILPAAFIVYRFDLFSGNKASIGGWGIFAILIVAVFIISLLNYIRKGLPYSMTSQCIKGFCKVILPLLAVLLIVWCIRNNLDAFIQSIGCVIVCETIAVPINPMPKWIHDNMSEEEQKKFENITDIVFDKWFEKKKDK